jgi:hypothetical protein
MICAPISLPLRRAGQELDGGLKGLLACFNVNDYAASVKVFAIKPRYPAY